MPKLSIKDRKALALRLLTALQGANLRLDGRVAAKDDRVRLMLHRVEPARRSDVRAPKRQPIALEKAGYIPIYVGGQLAFDKIDFRRRQVQALLSAEWRKWTSERLDSEPGGYDVQPGCPDPRDPAHYKTLKKARVAAAEAGKIRSRQTGQFVAKEDRPTLPKRPKPKPRRVRNERADDKLGGIIGRKTTILTTAAACLKHEPARFRLVPVSKLIPSHNGCTFKATKGYPKGVQERRYGTDKAEQAKVISNAQASCFEPALLANTDPSPLGGAPIVTQAGVVLGGNSRAMVLQRIYGRGKSAANEYRAFLKADAADWGFDSADVAAYKSPALVRVVSAAKPAQLKGAVRRYNEILTQEMDATAMQVATSARIGDSIIEQLKKMEPDETLLAFLQNPRSRSLVLELQRQQVITKQQTSRYIAKGGLLSEDGRRFFARALVGRVLPNADALDLLFNAKPSLRGNLARAVPFILLAGSVGQKWNVSNVMGDAARIFSAVRAGGHSSIKQYLAQRALFASGVKVTTASLLLAQIFLDKSGPLQLSRGFSKYADKAAESRTVDMWGPPPPPVQALAQAFGLKPIEGTDVLMVTSFSPTAVSTAQKNRKRNGRGNGRAGAKKRARK